MGVAACMNQRRNIPTSARRQTAKPISSAGSAGAQFALPRARPRDFLTSVLKLCYRFTNPQPLLEPFGARSVGLKNLMHDHQLSSSGVRFSRVAAITIAGCALLLPPTRAVQFGSGALKGSFDTTLSFGALYRLHDPSNANYGTTNSFNRAPGLLNSSSVPTVRSSI